MHGVGGTYGRNGEEVWTENPGDGGSWVALSVKCSTFGFDLFFPEVLGFSHIMRLNTLSGAVHFSNSRF